MVLILRWKWSIALFFVRLIVSHGIKFHGSGLIKVGWLEGSWLRVRVAIGIRLAIPGMTMVVTIVRCVKDALV